VLLFVLFAGAARAQEEPPSIATVSAGAMASLSDSSAVVPTATVDAEGPIFIGEGRAIARAAIRATFSGLPDATAVVVADVRTFNAVELVGVLERRFGTSDDGLSSSYFLGRGQFATKLQSDPSPRTRHPRAYGIGIAFERRNTAGQILRRVELTVGRSEIAHPDPSQGVLDKQLMVDAQIRLVSLLNNKAEIRVRVESHLNLQRSQPHTSRDVTRATVEAAGGWGAKS
jgi:hypothetical protein